MPAREEFEELGIRDRFDLRDRRSVSTSYYQCRFGDEVIKIVHAKPRFVMRCAAICVRVSAWVGILYGASAEIVPVVAGVAAKLLEYALPV